MRKVIAFLMVMVMIIPMATVASANTTTLTTTVPAATYTLNIPADQAIEYGRLRTSIGDISVTDATGFASGKNLEVTLSYDAFKCADESITTTIPFTIQAWGENTGTGLDLPSGSTIKFKGQTDGTVAEHYLAQFTESNSGYATSYRVIVASADWGKALAGDYSATITFTSKVVVE